MNDEAPREMTGPQLGTNVPAPSRGLYPSSYAALVLVASILVLVNVPGQVIFGPTTETIGSWVGESGLWTRCDHGWPKVFLRRLVNAPDATDGYTSGPWSAKSLWNLRTDVVAFSAVALTVDVAIACIVLVASVWLFERWRRQRRYIWQYHLIDLAGLVVVVSVIVGAWVNRTARHREESAVLAAMSDWVSPRWNPGGASILRQLEAPDPGMTYFDHQGFLALNYEPDSARWYAPFDRVVRLEYRHSPTDEELQTYERHLLAIARFRDVRSLLLRRLTRLEWDCVLHCPNICEIQLDLARIDLGEAADLPPNHSIRVFRGYSLELTTTGLAFLGQLPKLRTLFIGYINSNPPTNAPSTLAEGDSTLLAGLSDLRDLSLIDFVWSKGRLRKLLALRRLESLDLSTSQFVDGAQTALSEFRSLKELYLLETNVSEAEVTKLRQELPDCVIQSTFRRSQ